MFLKPLPIFNDMPWHIKQRIVDFVDPVSKLSVCRCSKELNSFVSRSPVQYEQFQISVFPEHIQIQLSLDKGTKFTRKFVLLDNKNEDHVTKAMDFSMKVLKNPKASFKNLEIHFEVDSEDDDGVTWPRFLRLLERNFKESSKLRAETFHLEFVDNQDDILKILPHLQPGYLKNIELHSIPLYFDPRDVRIETFISLDKVVELEQWKGARDLKTSFFNTKISVEKLAHFERVSLGQEHLDLVTIKQIVRNFLNNPSNKFAEIWFDSSDEHGIQEYLKQFKSENGVSKIPILGKEAEEFLVVFLDEYSWRVARK